MKTKSGGFAAPSLEGGMGWVSIDWGKLLKVIITVLTALVGAIGVASCAA